MTAHMLLAFANYLAFEQHMYVAAIVTFIEDAGTYLLHYKSHVPIRLAPSVPFTQHALFCWLQQIICISA